MKINHEGLHSKRLHPDAGNPLEVAYAKAWEEENAARCSLSPVLGHLIGDFTQRDAEVAATIIQWLGSNIGQSFVDEVLKKHRKAQL